MSKKLYVGNLPFSATEEQLQEMFSEFGTVESVKAVAELYLPIGGEILAVNSALEDAPELVNKDPYAEGWMVELKPSDPTQLDTLMNKAAYVEMLKGMKS